MAADDRHDGTPDVSVLLPYRDAEDTLAEALQSVLQERDVSFELIAVDDGSNDASARIVADAAAHDSRVRPLAGSGRGLVAALNQALQTARAPLLARMDADDVSLPGRLPTQAKRLQVDPAIAVLGTSVRAFPEHAVAEGMRRYVAWQNGLLEPEQHRAQLFVESPLCHPSVMLRREALLAVGGYRDGAFAEDYDLWLRLDAAGYAMAKLPAVLLLWRHHEGRATLRDPRYARRNFAVLKAPHLARRLRERGLPVDVWGAGQAGKRLARELERHGVRAVRFLDIDPKKLGRTARGAPIESYASLFEPGRHFVVVALAARGARDLARQELDARGYREGRDYLCGW
jgi:glycosyltransferase involved in cell wall biosynthesis